MKQLLTKSFWVSNPAYSLLLLLLIIGAALRVYGISFGLPFTYHEDEGFEVNRALQLAKGSFDFTRLGKGGYFYVLFVDFGLLFVAMKVIGAVDTTRDFALQFVKDPSWFYLVGRFTTAMIGTFSLYLTYVLGHKMFSRTVGVVAALFLCVNILHADHSHYITVDIPLTCLSLAAIIYMVRVYDTGRTRDYVLAGFFAALAAMTKMPGAILMVPFFLASLLNRQMLGKSIMAKSFNRQWILACLVFLVVYVIGNPGVIVNYQMILSMLKTVYGAGVKPESSGTSAEIIAAFNPWLFYSEALMKSMGPVVFLLAVVGMLIELVGRNWRASILLSFALLFFAVLVFSANPVLAYERYALPVLPFLSIFAARALIKLVGLIGSFRNEKLIWVTGVLAVLISVYGLLQVMETNKKYFVVDSRTAAKQWIEANVPELSTILIEGATAQVFRGTAPLLNTEDNIREGVAAFKARGQQGKAEYFKLYLDAVEGRRYDLAFYGFYNVESLSTYHDQGIEYVLVRPERLVRSPKYAQKGKVFVSSLQKQDLYKKIMAFDGENAGGTGPYLELYKRVPPAG